MQKNTKLLLVIIVIIAAILRLYKLGVNPIHITQDEAALGYNAFTILHTARDEHGEFLPVIFKSFGDYKPGLYVYLTVPFIALAGLDETTVRLPSALMGSLCPVLIYYLVREFKKTKKQALYAALVMALNPWHILFSRGAWESQVLISVLIAFIIMLVKYTNTLKSRYLYFASVLAGCAFLTYQGAKLAIPMVVLSWLIANPSLLHIKKHIKTYALSCVLFMTIAAPVLITFVDGRTGRLAVYNMFNYPRTQEEIERTILAPTNLSQGNIVFQLFHSESLNFARNALRKYGNYWSPQYLFFSGDWDHPLMSIPYMGNFYWWDAVFLMAGILYLARNLHQKESKFLLVYLLLVPIPAAISRDEINAVRSLPMIIPLVVLASHGAEYLYLRLNQVKYLKAPAFVALVGLYLFSIAYFLDIYWDVRPIKNAPDMYYGYKQAVQAVQEYRKQRLPIIMAQSYAQPYIFFRFYEQKLPVEPTSIHDDRGLDVFLVSESDGVNFRKIYWPDDQELRGHVFVADPENDITKNAILEKPEKFSSTDIMYPDQKTVAFRIVQVK